MSYGRVRKESWVGGLRCWGMSGVVSLNGLIELRLLKRGLGPVRFGGSW